MRVEAAQSVPLQNERNNPQAWEEWFGVRNPDTIKYLVPMLQVVYKNFLDQLSPVVDWQIMPDPLDYLELSLPSVFEKYVNKAIIGWGEKEGNVEVSLDGYRGNATVLYSQGHEIAKVFKEETGKTRIFVANKDTAFNSRLKALIILNDVNERIRSERIRMEANQEIESLEIREALFGADRQDLLKGRPIIVFPARRVPILQKAA